MPSPKPEPKPTDFKVVDEVKAPQFYVDGTVGMLVGSSVCKVMFHQSQGKDESDGLEVRKVVMQLCIPTKALVEFCANTLQSFAVNRDAIQTAMDAESAAMFGMLPTVGDKK